MASRPITSGVVDARQRVGTPPPHPTSLTLGDRRIAVVGSARLYVCGITPYDVTHLGHAATFVWADMVASVLDSTGVRPRVCRNITDVDDVLMDAARSRGRHFDEFALVQEAMFEQSMRALRVATPQEQPRARHHIEAVQQLAQALLDADAAYERDGTVWFRGDAIVERSGLTAGARARAGGGVRRRPGRPGQGGPVRRTGLACVGRRRPGLDQPVGLGATGLARRVRCHGVVGARPVGGRPRRRGGPRLPPPRLPVGDGRGGCRRHALREGGRPRRRGPDRRGQDGQVDRQPGAGRRRPHRLHPGRAAPADPVPALRRGRGTTTRPCSTMPRSALQRLYAAAGRPATRQPAPTPTQRSRCCAPTSTWSAPAHAPRPTAARWRAG